MSEQIDSKYISNFWNKVNKTSTCWEWQGGLSHGYGLAYNGKNTVGAHRFVLKYIKNIDIDNKIVCHHCDNPKCVNPDHLFVGTNLDNSRDMVDKGRQQKAEKHALSKLTNADVVHIKQQLQKPYWGQKAQLAEKFGVSESTIRDIHKQRSRRFG